MRTKNMNLKEINRFVKDAQNIKKYEEAIEIYTSYLNDKEDEAIQDILSEINLQKQKELKKIKARYRSMKRRKTRDENNNNQ
jgi:phosphotransferase system IIA component